MNFLKLIYVTVMMLVGFNAFAAFEGLNGGTSLKIFNRINCSTGLTCTRDANGIFKIVSSPTLDSGDLTVTGDEAANGLITIQADQSDDNGDDWTINSVASDNSLTFSNDTSGSAVAKLTVSTAGAVTMVGDLSGDGGDQLVGFLQNRILATATTLTAAQCGSTVYNGGAVEIELPEASTVLGCRYTFVTANAANFDVDPDAADQILVQTDAAGDMIRNATLGNSITIEAISASQWAVVGILGTWSDAN